MANLAAMTAAESFAVMEYYGFKTDGVSHDDDRMGTIMLGTALAAMKEDERKEAVRIIEAIVASKKYLR